MHTDPDFRYLRRGRVHDCRERQKERNDEAESIERNQNFTCLTEDIAYFSSDVPRYTLSERLASIENQKNSST